MQRLFKPEFADCFTRTTATCRSPCSAEVEPSYLPSIRILIGIVCRKGGGGVSRQAFQQKTRGVGPVLAPKQPNSTQKMAHGIPLRTCAIQIIKGGCRKKSHSSSASEIQRLK
jgi:hypothetical protein